MAVNRQKSALISPVFEKINQDLLKKCAQTAESAERAVETSKKLTEESRDLIHHVRASRRKSA